MICSAPAAIAAMKLSASLRLRSPTIATFMPPRRIFICSSARAIARAACALWPPSTHTSPPRSSEWRAERPARKRLHARRPSRVCHARGESSVIKINSAGEEQRRTSEACIVNLMAALQRRKRQIQRAVFSLNDEPAVACERVPFDARAEIAVRPPAFAASASMTSIASGACRATIAGRARLQNASLMRRDFRQRRAKRVLVIQADRRDDALTARR